MEKPPPSPTATTPKVDPTLTLQEYMTLCRARVETALDRWLPPAQTTPQDLHAAMRYAALSGGKYVRPLLVYAAGRTFGVPFDVLDGPACAVELIHAYSLVHDDLPAMDNAELRRGQATCHQAHGEALAILAGDALQALAFHILAHDPALEVPSAHRLRMIDTLAVAGGSLGMAGGQAIDLAAVGQHLDLTELENMHTRKTGALIRASVLLGALCCAELADEVIHRLAAYAKCIGLAFQIHDDILDVEGDTATLGKTPGADVDRAKPTYPALLGLAGAKREAGEMHARALASLETFGPEAEPLRWISEYVVRRSR